MLAFSRITSVLFFVLSLSFFAYAAPTPSYNSNEVAPSYEKAEKVHSLLLDLKGKLDIELPIMLQASTIAQASAKADVCIEHVTACAKAILAVGAKLIVRACLALVAKFGVLVLLTLLAKVDICLQLLIVNLGVCFEGIAHLIAGIVVKLGINVLASVHLGLCISVLGLINLGH